MCNNDTNETVSCIWQSFPESYHTCQVIVINLMVHLTSWGTCRFKDKATAGWEFPVLHGSTAVDARLDVPMGKPCFLWSLPLLTILAGFLAFSPASGCRADSRHSMGVSCSHHLDVMAGPLLTSPWIRNTNSNLSHFLGFSTPSTLTTAPP